MYEPAPHQAANWAFLWPALAAASISEMAALVAKQCTNFAVGEGAAKALQQNWTTPHAVALELKTVQLRDFSTQSRPRGGGSAGSFPALLCAPFALHGASVCDLAPGHSLVAALRDNGLARLFVTDWRSATAEMRFCNIDDYLADLNVLVDEIGPPLDLIGLCQGGWMSLIYAARFPAKVRKLVLAASPVDIAAASSPLSAIAEVSPLAMFEELARLGDGLIPGSTVLKFWGPETIDAETIAQLLESDHPIDSPAFKRLEALFRDWYYWTLDLPGAYFLEVVDKLYKRNELATNSFIALGRKIDLNKLTAPIFLLAARDDELVAPAQLFSVERLVGTKPRNLRKATAPCRHVGLFMGKRILEGVWPGIARWLQELPSHSQAHIEAPEFEPAHR